MVQWLECLSLVSIYIIYINVAGTCPNGVSRYAPIFELEILD